MKERAWGLEAKSAEECGGSEQSGAAGMAALTPDVLACPSVRAGPSGELLNENL